MQVSEPKGIQMSLRSMSRRLSALPEGSALAENEVSTADTVPRYALRTRGAAPANDN